MKKLLFVIVGLIIIGSTFLAIKGSEVQEIKTAIEISAPPSKVWPVLVDVNGWQQWNPIISHSSGTAAVGSKLSITMVGKEEGKDGPKYSPIITELDEPHYYRWRAHMLAEFIFTNEKIIELEKTDTGTRLTHIETFSGLLAPIMCGQMEIGVPPMLNSMNHALKKLAEK